MCIDHEKWLTQRVRVVRVTARVAMRSVIPA